ncbi:MAG: hypothetical protein R2748_17795 [Bryobacterales bacterium]
MEDGVGRDGGVVGAKKSAEGSFVSETNASTFARSAGSSTETGKT